MDELGPPDNRSQIHFVLKVELESFSLSSDGPTSGRLICSNDFPSLFLLIRVEMNGLCQG